MIYTTRSIPRPLARATMALTAAALTVTLAACASSAHDSLPPSSMPTPLPSSTHAAPASNGLPVTAGMLRAYFWDLTGAYDGRGNRVSGYLLPGRAAPRLQFLGNSLSVDNLCNIVNASYALTGDRLLVGRGMSTMRGCMDRDVAALDQLVGGRLPHAERVALQRTGPEGSAPSMVLHFNDGSRWELAGTPTPETRFGAAGERMFMEVAAERVACNHPLIRNAQCLRVRDVFYADNGVKQREGEWRNFYGDIEGYRHEHGIRNVLRVNRYPVARPGEPLPADAPSHAYVLDMVVESERMR
jgi:hypothetical protein